MNIAVCVKVIINKSLIEDFGMKEPFLNDYDISALCLAIKFKKKYGGYIKVISLTPISSKRVLKCLYYYGVDEVIILSDKAFSGSDTLATSLILSTALKKMGESDLVICGEKSVDGETAQVPGQIASFMNMVFITKVNSLIYKETLKAEIVQEDMKYKRKLLVELPAVVTTNAQKEDQLAPSFERIRKYYDQEPIVWTNQILNIDVNRVGTAGSATFVDKLLKNNIPKGDCKFCPKNEFALVLSNQIKYMSFI